MIPPLTWEDDPEGGHVRLLDQTRLPAEEHYLTVRSADQMAEAIRALRVRGAPAIGIAAAYGVVLALREGAEAFEGEPHEAAAYAADLLSTTRPTAVNLFHALGRMRAAVERHAALPRADFRAALLAEARAYEEEDRAAGRALGRHGLSVLRPVIEAGGAVLTHCHTGGVATSGYGTALAAFHLAAEEGLRPRVYADETRPLLQGSRITAWELHRAGIDVTLVTDSMAAHVMRTGRVQAVIVGADRIAANGDTANKIGTYGLAVLARHHGLPFYVSAPVSTVDPLMRSGDTIEIEERAADEVRLGFGRATAPADVPVFNPAFDVTPADLITAIITERGVVEPPFEAGLASVHHTATAPA